MMTLTQRMVFHDSLRYGGAEHHRQFLSALHNLWSQLQANPEAVAALAHTLAPETDDLPSAYDTATDRVAQLQRDIAAAVAETNQKCREEAGSLKDHVAYASHRIIELIGEKQKLERLLERGASESVLKTREKMRNAGVPERELDRIAPLLDHDELRAQIDALDAESATLGQFTRTADESILPADFADRARAYKELQEQMRTARGPNLAVMGP